jgi:uncharacterized protein (TIGR02118 family)
MRKVVNLLVRSPDMSHEEFATYLREEHAPLAEGLPGVETYTVSLPADPERSAFDGISELYLEPGTSLGDVFGSDVGEAVQADTENFMDTDASELLVVDEEVRFSRRDEQA